MRTYIILVTKMKDLPKRKTNRLRDYDYSKTGVYFITICTKDRYEFFWKSDVDAVGANCVRPRLYAYPHLSECGNIVEGEIAKIPKLYENIEIPKHIVMPNHIHMIIAVMAHGRTQCLAW